MMYLSSEKMLVTERGYDPRLDTELAHWLAGEEFDTLRQVPTRDLYSVRMKTSGVTTGVLVGG